MNDAGFEQNESAMEVIREAYYTCICSAHQTSECTDPYRGNRDPASTQNVTKGRGFRNKQSKHVINTS